MRPAKRWCACKNRSIFYLYFYMGGSVLYRNGSYPSFYIACLSACHYLGNLANQLFYINFIFLLFLIWIFQCHTGSTNWRHSTITTWDLTHTAPWHMSAAAVGNKKRFSAQNSLYKYSKYKVSPKHKNQVYFLVNKMTLGLFHTC